MARVATAIGRRVVGCAEAYAAGDWERALLSLFPAIDRTAKTRRPKAKVGERFRSFIDDEEDIVSVAATGSLIVRNRFFGKTFADAIYEFARNSLVHEGELDPRLQFNAGMGITLGHTWNLPSNYIPAMLLAVVAARENAGEWTNSTFRLATFGRDERIDALWGIEDALHAEVKARFPR